MVFFTVPPPLAAPDSDAAKAEVDDVDADVVFDVNALARSDHDPGLRNLAADSLACETKTNKTFSCHLTS